MESADLSAKRATIVKWSELIYQPNVPIRQDFWADLLTNSSQMVNNTIFFVIIIIIIIIIIYQYFVTKYYLTIYYKNYITIILYNSKFLPFVTM